MAKKVVPIERPEERGAVARSIVIRALQHNGVSVVQLNDFFTLIKGDMVEVVPLADPVHKRMLQNLQRKFGIPIEHFYHPELLTQISSRFEKR